MEFHKGIFTSLLTDCRLMIWENQIRKMESRRLLAKDLLSKPPRKSGVFFQERLPGSETARELKATHRDEVCAYSHPKL
jgi:hypothetical protein